MAYDGEIRISTALDNQQLNNDLQSMSGLIGKALGGIDLSVGGLSAGLLQIGKLSIGAGKSFESAFAGVIKTVDASEVELASLRSEFRELAKVIPLTANEFANIGEAAGQLGIAKESIVDFTKTMAALGAATNMTADQAATEFARFANIVQMPQDNFDRLGSTIVALGNNLATTEAEISTMAQRLAAAGNQAGLAESEIFGFAGALSSVGIEAEAGGTAFSKVFTNINLAVQTGSKDLEKFAQVAGMATSDFAKYFEEDAAGAITAFITGLADVERTGKSTVAILEEMGITEIRMRDALTRAAGAGELFGKSIDIANRAWEENTALTTEAEARYSTLDSKIQMLNNSVTDLGIGIYDSLREPIAGSIDVVQGLVTAFSELPAPVQEFVTISGAMVGVLGAGYTAFKTLSAAKEIYAAIVGKTAVAEVGATAATAANTTANVANVFSIKALTAAMLSSPLFIIGAAALAIGGIITAVDYLSHAYERQTEKVSNLTSEYATAKTELEAVQGQQEKIAKKIAEIKGLSPEQISDPEEIGRLERVNEELQRQHKFLQDVASIKEAKLESEEITAAKMLSDELEKQAQKYAEAEEKLATLNQKMAEGTVLQDIEIHQLTKYSNQLESSKQYIIDNANALDAYTGKLSGSTTESANAITKIQTLEAGLGALFDQWKVNAGIADETTQTIAGLGDETEQTAQDTEDLVGAEKELGETLLEAADMMKSASKEAKTLADMRAQLEKTGTLDNSSLEELIDLYPEAVAYAGDLVGMQKFLQDKVQDAENAYLQSMGSIIFANEEAINQIINTSSALPGALAAYYGADANNFIKMSGEKYKIESQTVQSLSDLWAKYANMTSQQIKTQLEGMKRSVGTGRGVTPEMTQAIKELQVMSDMYKTLETQAKSLSTTATVPKATGGGGSGGGGSAVKQKEEEVREVIKLELDSIDKQIELRKLNEKDRYNALKNMLSSYGLNTKERLYLEEALHDSTVKLSNETRKAQEEQAKELQKTLQDKSYDTVFIQADESQQKLDIISEEYLDRMQWIKDENSLYSDAVNTQMLQEFDRNRERLQNLNSELDVKLLDLSVTNQALAEEIQGLRDRNDQIKEGQQLRAEEKREVEELSRLSELERKYTEETDSEKKVAIKEQINALQDTRKERQLQREEQEEIVANNNIINEKQKEITENIKQAEQAAKDFNAEVENTANLLSQALDFGVAEDIELEINIEGASGIGEALKKAVSGIEGQTAETTIGTTVVSAAGADKMQVALALKETEAIIKEFEQPLTDATTEVTQAIYWTLQKQLETIHSMLQDEIIRMRYMLTDELNRTLEEVKAIAAAIAAAADTSMQIATSFGSATEQSALGGQGEATNGAIVEQNFNFTVMPEETAFSVQKEAQRALRMGEYV